MNSFFTACLEAVGKDRLPAGGRAVLNAGMLVDSVPSSPVPAAALAGILPAPFSLSPIHPLAQADERLHIVSASGSAWRGEEVFPEGGARTPAAGGRGLHLGIDILEEESTMPPDDGMSASLATSQAEAGEGLPPVGGISPRAAGLSAGPVPLGSSPAEGREGDFAEMPLSPRTGSLRNRSERYLLENNNPRMN